MFFCNYWTLSNLKGKKTFVINKSTTIMGKIFETNSSFMWNRAPGEKLYFYF